MFITRRFKKLSTDLKIKWAFSLGFALLCALPMIVWWNKERMVDSAEWVSHTHEVIATLEATSRSISDAESIERGYIITGHESYAGPFEATCFQTKNLLVRLQSLTADNATQQHRIALFKPLVLEKLDAMTRAIALRRSLGLAAAVEMTQTDTGKRLMDSIRTQIAEMRREEEAMLGERNTRFGVIVKDGWTIFLLAMGLNFCTVLFSLFMVNRYIRHRRETENTLKEAKEIAESANTAKSAFLANMSHEIRTPMTAIVGYADLLLDPRQTQSDKLDNLQTIRRNARHLLELINDILDLSKIEAGKMKVERIDCELPQLIGDVVSLMRPRAMEKGLDFKLNFATPIPKKMKTDPLRLRQVLVNLIGNAIKFTEAGHVELRISCEVQNKCARVRFDVRDTGIGITREQMTRLFQPFNQADDSMTRRFGGSGLGLTISQRLSTLLGGQIGAHSEPDKGSVFSVTLDAGTVEDGDLVDGLDESMLTSKSHVPKDPVITLVGRILLAEDGRDNQRLITLHLRRAGAEVVLAENGRIAVDLATQQRFDLILMDMQMPEMDGYEATSELRRRGMTLPIIALTAHAMADDRSKCLAAGCSDYLTKPVDKELLLATINSYLKSAAAAAAAAPKPVVPRSPVRSTFADDVDMKPIIAEFVANLPEQVKQIEELLSQNNLAALKRAVHQLKGSGGGYGFQAVTDTAAVAEQQLADAAPLPAIEAKVKELTELLRSIEGFVPAVVPQQSAPAAAASAAEVVET
jgi:signal transduction histidine kinase/DNA-binding response OmpR family regulator